MTQRTVEDVTPYSGNNEEALTLLTFEPEEIGLTQTVLISVFPRISRNYTF
ncbi:MAG: hypothetical protein RIM23_11990 [Coleofasciculus sp. G3-WIS-01]|uniref:hypothetical protein n=1 Tax=Coleofasciculus sp. G3-WIS-01 TaxID=3069528 RepID=UPI0033042071